MIKRLNFKKIDAFTDGSSSGNPAGCVVLEAGLNDEEMLKIAYELKGFVSEVGYIREIGNEYQLKYYSSEREVEFCGHATIAIMYDLISNNDSLMKKEEVFINVNAGKLSVFNKIKDENAVYIMAPSPEYLECRIAKGLIAKALKIDDTQIRDDLSIDIINGGLKTLLVPIRTLECCVNISPDIEPLKKFCEDNDIDIIHIFTKETYNNDSDFRIRVFAPTFGYLEDPATGSGNAAFGYYLIKNNMWYKDIMIEQSGNLKNPNYIKLKKFNNNGHVHILFGGSGMTRMEGKYYLSSVE